MVIKADKKSLSNFRRAPMSCDSDNNEDSRVFLIVGGGEK